MQKPWTDISVAKITSYVDVKIANFPPWFNHCTAKSIDIWPDAKLPGLTLTTQDCTANIGLYHSPLEVRISLFNGHFRYDTETLFEWTTVATISLEQAVVCEFWHSDAHQTS